MVFTLTPHNLSHISFNPETIIFHYQVILSVGESVPYSLIAASPCVMKNVMQIRVDDGSLGFISLESSEF